MALVLITSKNSRRSRKLRALWAMTRREAQAVCGDPRTSGRSYMLTWTDRPGTEGADWEWVPDNGSHAPVLDELGITPRREWAAAPQAPWPRPRNRAPTRPPAAEHAGRTGPSLTRTGHHHDHATPRTTGDHTADTQEAGPSSLRQGHHHHPDVPRGGPDIQCRYPVIVGEDQVIGRAYRWHREWFVLTTEGAQPPPPTEGDPRHGMAAAHLAKEYAAGRIGAVPLDQVLAEAPTPLCGPVPLLHPRTPVNDRNIEGALIAFADSRPTTGGQSSPGSRAATTTGTSAANCATGRARSSGATCADAREQPPSARRHKGGCIGEDKVGRLIPAYH